MVRAQLTSMNSGKFFKKHLRKHIFCTQSHMNQHKIHAVELPHSTLCLQFFRTQFHIMKRNIVKIRYSPHISAQQCLFKQVPPLNLMLEKRKTYVSLWTDSLMWNFRPRSRMRFTGNKHCGSFCFLFLFIFVLFFFFARSFLKMYTCVVLFLLTVLFIRPFRSWLLFDGHIHMK